MELKQAIDGRLTAIGGAVLDLASGMRAMIAARSNVGRKLDKLFGDYRHLRQANANPSAVS